MSWWIRKAGKGLDVAPEVGKAIESATNGMGDSEQTLVRALGKAITDFAEKNPEAVIIVSTNGHVSSDGGTAELKLERIV